MNQSQAGTPASTEKVPARRGRKPNHVRERERLEALHLLEQQQLAAQQHGGAVLSAPGPGPGNRGDIGQDERPAKRERGDGGTRERRDRQRLQRKNLFAKELPSMLYAYGDDPEPLPESVAVLEEIMVDYLTDLCKSAGLHSTNAKKLKMDDLRFALRKPQQAKQLARVEELLYLQEDIARARKNLDISYGKNAMPL